MPTIILTMTESQSELVAGIPEYVEFSTSEPSTVFYTIDGADPDEDSSMASGRVYMPVGIYKFTLKAIALIQESASVILEEEYEMPFLDIERIGRVNDEGIQILPFGKAVVDSLGVDADGEDARNTSVEVVDLDIKSSRTNRIGESLADGTSVDFINFVEYEIDEIEGEYISSPNNGNVDFNPNAKVIIMNGFELADRESQVVRIINRPHGTMSVTSQFYNEHLQQEPIITGNFVRSMYNPETKKIIFYYTESRENRWIKSAEKVESPTTINLTGHMEHSFVFQWIEDRAMSKIF
jgi:hypothetical protein